MTRRKRANGEGSIYKRKDGRWCGRITIGKNPDTGKPDIKTFYGKTRKEVDSKLSEVKAKLQEGTYTEPSKQDTGEYLDQWLNTIKASVRITTFESYETQIRKHIKPAIGHIKLQQLQTRHIQNLINDKMDGGNLSTRSIKYIHVVLNNALQQAIKEQLIKFNPAVAVKLPKQEKKEVEALTVEQVKAFMEMARQTRHYTAYLVELSTGLRRGELLALKWKNIDLEEGTLQVKENLVITKNGAVFQEPKTKTSKRVINLPPHVVTELRKHKKAQAEERLRLGGQYEDNDLVFCRKDGKPLYPRSFSEHFEKLVRKLQEEGFPKITFHGLRHTFATLALQAGVEAKTLQDILGHSTIGITLDIYSHTTKTMREEATKKISGIMENCL